MQRRSTCCCSCAFIARRATTDLRRSHATDIQEADFARRQRSLDLGRAEGSGPNSRAAGHTASLGGRMSGSWSLDPESPQCPADRWQDRFPGSGASPPVSRLSWRRIRRRRRWTIRPSGTDRKPIDAFERAQASLLILTHHNATARSFRGLFNRRVLLWEGYTRNTLEKLVDALRAAQGDRVAVATATVAFLKEMGKGFSASALGDRFSRKKSKTDAQRVAVASPPSFRKLTGPHRVVQL